LLQVVEREADQSRRRVMELSAGAVLPMFRNQFRAAPRNRYRVTFVTTI
jgi:hypothetical protein